MLFGFDLAAVMDAFISVVLYDIYVLLKFWAEQWYSRSVANEIAIEIFGQMKYIVGLIIIFVFFDMFAAFDTVYKFEMRKCHSPFS